MALPAWVTEALVEHLGTDVPGADDALVFGTGTSNDLARSSWSATWGRPVRACDLPPVRPHELRHTGATLAAHAGATTADLMGRLRHASPAAALVHQHATSERDSGIARALDVLTSGGTVTPMPPARKRSRSAQVMGRSQRPLEPLHRLRPRRCTGEHPPAEVATRVRPPSPLSHRPRSRRAGAADVLGRRSVRETGGSSRLLDLEPAVPQGTVRWFDPERGFGFLAPEDGSADLFVHASEIASEGGARLLREGQAVEFEVGEGDRGPQARRVRVTGDVAADTPLGVLGTVAWYEPGKGYGFATPDDGGPEVFVHSSAIVAGGVVSAGQRVAFLVVEGERGLQAEHVLPLGPGAGRPAAGDGADGTVTWYDEDKGFGFVTPDAGGDDVFVHVRALAEGLTWLAEGDRVTYEVVAGDKGPQARDLHLVRGAAGADAPSAPNTPKKAASATARAGEGVVVRYDADRGFGFITPDAGGADLFVHTSVVSDPEPLRTGERVRFTVRQSDRGPQADRVERL